MTKVHKKSERGMQGGLMSLGMSSKCLEDSACVCPPDEACGCQGKGVNGLVRNRAQTWGEGGGVSREEQLSDFQVRSN